MKISLYASYLSEMGYCYLKTIFLKLIILLHLCGNN